MKTQCQVLYFLYVGDLLFLCKSLCSEVGDPAASQLVKAFSKKLVLMGL
jgi:hypothetical protein